LLFPMKSMKSTALSSDGLPLEGKNRKASPA